LIPFLNIPSQRDRLLEGPVKVIIFSAYYHIPSLYRNLQQAGIKVAGASSGVKVNRLVLVAVMTILITAQRVAEDVPNVTKRAKSSHTTIKHTKPVESTPETNASPKKSEATTSEEVTTKSTDVVTQEVDHKKHKKKKKHKHSKGRDMCGFVWFITAFYRSRCHTTVSSHRASHFTAVRTTSS